MKQMMQSMQSTMQAFGGSIGRSSGSSGSGNCDSLSTFLEALKSDSGSQQKGKKTGGKEDEGSTQELLQGMTEQMQKTFGSFANSSTRAEPLLSVTT